MRPHYCITLDDTPCGTKILLLFKPIESQSIERLHGSVICHMNGNFVGFQNMCDCKRPDN